jgi:aspartyl-tRNA(Asn)/glutamyl-tRNA(Gln) amidotransferase subunit C
MKITKQEIEHVARLARLNLAEQEVDKFARQLSDVLDYVDILSSVDTKGVAPTSHAIPVCNVFRQDAVQPSLLPEEAVKAAPQEEENQFIVPKVI